MARHTFIFEVKSLRTGEITDREYTTIGATWEDCCSAAISRAHGHGSVVSMMMKVGRTK